MDCEAFMPKASPLICIPDERPARWALLFKLIAGWYRPVSQGDGYENDVLDRCQNQNGIILPLAMREWYTTTGRMDDIWCCQDLLVEPEKLRFEAGILTFYRENQCVTSWGIRQDELLLEDPPVVVRDENDEWVVQSLRLSEFVLHMFVYVIQFGNHPAQIHGYAHPACVQRLKTLPKLGFPQFIWTRSTLFGFEDLVVAIDGTDHVSASARSVEAMGLFRELLTQEDFDIISENVLDADSD